MHKNAACVSLFFEGSVSDLTRSEILSVISPRLLDCDAFMRMSLETVSLYRSNRYEMYRPD